MRDANPFFFNFVILPFVIVVITRAIIIAKTGIDPIYVVKAMILRANYGQEVADAYLDELRRRGLLPGKPSTANVIEEPKIIIEEYSLLQVYENIKDVFSCLEGNLNILEKEINIIIRPYQEQLDPYVDSVCLFVQNIVATTPEIFTMSQIIFSRYYSNFECIIYQ